MVQTAVSNATPLIYLAKIGRIGLLKKLFEILLIPEAVHQEVVVKGKELKKKEVTTIIELIEEGFIQIREAKKKLKGIETLHRGELEVLSIAKENGILTVIIDNKEGVEVAKILDLLPLRTTALLLILNKNNELNYEELSDALLDLSREGYFMKTEVFDRLVKEASGP